MLKFRIITALVLAPVALTMVFFLPSPWFAIAVSVVILAAAWEWASMMRLLHTSQRLAYVLFVLLIMLVTEKYLLTMVPELLMVSGFWWLLASAMVVSYPKLTKPWRSRINKGLIGVLVLIPGWLALITIREMASGPWLIFYLLLLVWGADTGAYFAGKRYGKRKLMPKVSPAKSWAGVGGGALVVLIVSVCAWPFFDFTEIYPLTFYFLAMIVMVASVMGDLLESMFKRQCGIKDSGCILPGHGGVMDRIDSLTAAAPIFALGLIIIGV